MKDIFTDDPERPEFSDEDCKFVIRLLTFCGGCVALGLMKEFTILHSDIDTTNASIQGSIAKRPMLDAYNKFNELSKDNNPFEENEDADFEETEDRDESEYDEDN